MNAVSARSLPAARRLLQMTAGIYTLLFLATVQIFVFAPDRLIAVFNQVSSIAFPSLAQVHDSNRFWVSMAASMMYCISALCFMIWRDPVRWADMAVPVVIAKFASSACGIGYFFAGLAGVEPQWATLPNLTICLTDLPLGLFLSWVYRRCQTSTE